MYGKGKDEDDSVKKNVQEDLSTFLFILTCLEDTPERGLVIDRIQICVMIISVWFWALILSLWSGDGLPVLVG